MTADPLLTEAKMSEFARTFPSMAAAEGVSLWDAQTFDRWARDSFLSDGELATARLLLAVWDPATVWQCGPFNVMEALKIWDPAHRAAFLAWAIDPWWP
jgi:hypothetical protein